MIKKQPTNKSDAKTNAFTTNYSLLLTSIIAAGTTNLGEKMQRDAAFITRVKSDETRMHLSEFARLITHCNLELFEREDDIVKIERGMFDALKLLSTAGLQKATQNTNTGEDTVVINMKLYATLKYLAEVGMRYIANSKA